MTRARPASRRGPGRGKDASRARRRDAASRPEELLPAASTGWVPREWPLLVSLYLAAFLWRLQLLQMAPYGDEGMVYGVARRLGDAPSNVQDVYGPLWYHPRQIFFQRPAYYLLTAPFANVSFDAYRLFLAAATSLLPVLAVAVLRDARVRRVLAYPIGAVMALDPIFWVWGIIGLMDSLMTTAFVGAVWAFQRRLPVTAAALLLLATWIKETVVVGFVALLVASIVVGSRTGVTSLRQGRLTRFQLAALLLLPLAGLPVAYYIGFGGVLPGGPRADLNVAGFFDRLFMTAWLLPVILAGFAWRRTRPWTALALVFPAFFIGIHVVGGRAVEIWYIALPAALSLIALGASLDEAWNRTRRVRPRIARAAIPVLALAVAGLFAVEWSVPATSERGTWTKPVSRITDYNLEEVMRFQEIRDQDLLDAADHLPQDPGRLIFAIDVEYSAVLHPLADEPGHLRLGYTWLTEFLQQEIEPWVTLLESDATATLINQRDFALNAAVRHVYGDCITYERDRFLILDGRPCAGRGAQLELAYQERRTETEA